MIPDHIPFRNIVWTQKFEADLYGLLGDRQIADEFVSGAEWLLARDPTIGQKLSIWGDVWALPLEDIPEMPDMAIYYTFNTEKVFLLGLLVRPKEWDSPF